MRVELRQAGSNRLLERLELDEIPQPGRWLVVEDRSFLVLQRHHRYQLRSGRYELTTVALQVIPAAVSMPVARCCAVRCCPRGPVNAVPISPTRELRDDAITASDLAWRAAARPWSCLRPGCR